MKKYLILLLSLTCCICLTAFFGCKDEKESSSQSSSSSIVIDYGTLSVGDVSTYIGYYGEIKPIFSNPTYASEITYSYDENALLIQGDKVYSKLNQTGNYTVTATTQNHSATFTVSVKDGSSYLNSNFQTYLNTLDTNLSNFSHDEGKLALYIGDSFFDNRYFFTDFYSRFQGKNAFTWGISSSTCYQWIWYCQKIWKYNPSDIIIHIGTNDVFDAWQSQFETVASLKKLFTEIHKNLPNTHIYWYSIEPRIGANDSTGNATCEEINASIKTYIDSKDYVTYLDSYTPFKNDKSLYGDTVHPTCPNGYNVMTNLLTATGFTFSDNTKFTAEVEDYSTTTADSFGTSKTMPCASGSFVYRADVKITSYTTNGHVTLNFNADMNNRFLLWDSSSTGKFYVCGASNGIHTNTSTFFIDNTSTPTFEVAVYVSQTTGFIFINKTLVAVHNGLTNVHSFSVGTEGICADFKNVKVYTNTIQKDKYNEYANANGVSSYNVSSSTKSLSIIASGSVTTDFNS